MPTKFVHGFAAASWRTVDNLWTAIRAALRPLLPGLLLLLAAMPFRHELGGWGTARSAFAGVNAAVVGILAAALYTPVWMSAVTAPIDVAIAAAGFALLLTNRMPPIVVVGLAALAGQLVPLTG